MKKSLIALAVMAAAGAASAQSSVTLFGIVDATLQWTKGDAGDVRFRVTNSGYNSSRLGFRGTEDLGGGMSASFWLEGQLSNDDGTPGGLNFLRRSTVSLAGGWGELRIGRDYAPHFWNQTVFDPFGTNGSGTTLTMAPAMAVAGGVTPFGYGNAVRVSNSIGYFAPANLGGFYGQAMYGENELPNNVGATVDNGRYFGLRAGYASGPFNVAFGWGRTDIAGGDIRQANLAGQWDFGMAKVMAQYEDDDWGAGVDGRGWLLGALVPVGAGEIRASYSEYRADFGAGVEPRARKLALGYVHNLSKRTALYATVAHLTNNSQSNVGVNAAARAGAPGTGFGDSSTALDLGVRHSF